LHHVYAFHIFYAGHVVQSRSASWTAVDSNFVTHAALFHMEVKNQNKSSSATKADGNRKFK